MDSIQDWLVVRLGGRVRWALWERDSPVVLFAADGATRNVAVRAAVLARADREGDLERDVRGAWQAARAQPGEWVRAEPPPVPKAESGTGGRKSRAAGAEGLTNSA